MLLFLFIFVKKEYSVGCIEFSLSRKYRFRKEKLFEIFELSGICDRSQTAINS